MQSRNQATVPHQSTDYVNPFGLYRGFESI